MPWWPWTWARVSLSRPLLRARGLPILLHELLDVVGGYVPQPGADTVTRVRWMGSGPILSWLLPCCCPPQEDTYPVLGLQSLLQLDACVQVDAHLGERHNSQVACHSPPWAFHLSIHYTSVAQGAAFSAPNLLSAWPVPVTINCWNSEGLRASTLVPAD